MIFMWLTNYGNINIYNYHCLDCMLQQFLHSFFLLKQMQHFFRITTNLGLLQPQRDTLNPVPLHCGPILERFVLAQLYFKYSCQVVR